MMQDEKFVKDFEEEFKVKVKEFEKKREIGDTGIFHESKAEVYSWRGEVEIVGNYIKMEDDLLPYCLEHDLAFWYQAGTLLLDEEGFQELKKAIKEDWGE